MSTPKTAKDLDLPSHESSLLGGPQETRSHYASTPQFESVKRQIGVFSAVFIIFNRIIGTGIFATPSMILRLTGSVGLSLAMWVTGAIIAAAGMQVYITWGTALPRNGGEKNYLEYIFPKPKGLILSVYASFAVNMAFSAGNSLIFAEYLLLSIFRSSPPAHLIRPTAFLCLSFASGINGLYLTWGLRLQNALGILKLVAIMGVIVTGVFAHLGYFAIESNVPETPDNWTNVWEGSRWGASEICLALYNVSWSFVGFSNANYAMSEMRNPARTIRLAGIIAIVVVTLLYLLVNFAYLSGISKSEILGSGRLIAAILARNVWGPLGERFVCVAVALSALGNVLSVSFAQGRVNQELGREGVLPWSDFWVSNKPRNAPLRGLGLHWLVCSLVVLFVPPGDTYNFVMNIITYPLAVINAVISFGLVYILLSAYSPASPFPSSLSLTSPRVLSALFFGFINVFLFIAPLARPPDDAMPYEKLPYWTHALGGWMVFFLGALWWLWRRRSISEVIQ